MIALIASALLGLYVLLPVFLFDKAAEPFVRLKRHERSKTEELVVGILIAGIPFCFHVAAFSLGLARWPLAVLLKRRRCFIKNWRLPNSFQWSLFRALLREQQCPVLDLIVQSFFSPRTISLLELSVSGSRDCNCTLSHSAVRTFTPACMVSEHIWKTPA